LAAAMNKCTSVAGNFDDHGGAPMQYGAHRPMQHVQGFTGSHRTLPSGDYSLCIAPAATRATINTTIMEHMYPLFWPFLWPSQCGGTIPHASPDGGGSWLS